MRQTGWLGSVLVIFTLACGGVDPDVTGVVRLDATSPLVSNERIVFEDGQTHNENTELLRLANGRILLAFRGGATGQDGAGRIFILESQNDGTAWTRIGEVAMPVTTPVRDIRDPKLVERGGVLTLYAIARTTQFALRDQNKLTWTVRSESTDGDRTWTTPVKTFEDVTGGTETHWGFWRFTRRPWRVLGETGDTLYATAYDDGDIKVGFFSSLDGRTWVKRGLVIDAFADIPSEAELQFLGRRRTTAVSLVRLDNQNWLDHGETAVCTRDYPFRGDWECSRRIEQRLDGPTWLVWRDPTTDEDRHFVFARESLSCTRKRTAVYELRGDLDLRGQPIQVCFLGRVSSAGDTAYTAVLPTNEDAGRFLLTWYSTPPDQDVPWLQGQVSKSDIWAADVDLSLASRTECPAPPADELCPPAPLPTGARFDLSGTYRLTLRPVVIPIRPVRFAATVTTAGNALTFTLTPLREGSTSVGDTVGPAVTATGTLDATGTFTVELDESPYFVPSAAFNLAGQDIPVIDLTFTGRTTSADAASGGADARFYFSAIGPNDYIDIQGSTFTLERP